MKEDFEIKGLWWLPDYPETKLSGTLSFDPVAGVKVDLFGAFPKANEPSDAESALFWKAEIVLGHAANGEPMTLLHCYETSSTFSYNAFASERFPTKTIGASVLIKGEHFNRKEDIRFNKLSFQFARAKDWGDVTQIQSKQEDETATFSYTRPEPMEISLPNSLNLSLDWGLSIHQGFEGTSLTKFLSWIVESDVERGLDEWWKTQYLLGAFLTLATRHTVHPTEVYQAVGVEVELPEGKTGKAFHRTELFWDVSSIEDEKKTEGGYGMLFVLRDLGEGKDRRDQLEKSLRCWFEKEERLEAICELYIGTIHNKGLYPIHRFSNLIQALESYHRAASNQDMTLRNRINALVAVYEDVVSKSYDKRTDFAQKVLDTRNYLTHYNPNKKAHAAEGQELYDLSQSLQRLVEMSLLLELEIERPVVAHILTRDRLHQDWLEKSLKGLY